MCVFKEVTHLYRIIKQKQSRMHYLLYLFIYLIYCV